MTFTVQPGETTSIPVNNISYADSFFDVVSDVALAGSRPFFASSDSLAPEPATCLLTEGGLLVAALVLRRRPRR
jgi:hypothetical protein